MAPDRGIQGSVRSLSLADLLQVWSMNRFSGLIAVSDQGRSGHLYLVDGEIVHAEAAGLAGEPALQAVLAWPDSSFECLPNTTTLKRTIHKRVDHLLLEAHRVLDEARRDGAPTLAPPAGAPAARPDASPGPLDRIRAIPGVIRLERFGGDGRPTGDASPESEALAARALYLALAHAGAVGQAFGLHDLAVASLQGTQESFVLLHARGSYLCVEVAPGTTVEPVAAQVRALLARPAGRSP